NAIDRRCALLLKEKAKMHPVSHSAQRGVNAGLGSPELTPREAEVLSWISEGKSNRAIGVILGAKTGTICKHVEHIFSKLNVENRTAAAIVALETCRSLAPIPASKAVQAWAVITGFITTQFCALWP